MKTKSKSARRSAPTIQFLFDFAANEAYRNAIATMQGKPQSVPAADGETMAAPQVTTAPEAVTVPASPICNPMQPECSEHI